jgi:hypothetical protein
VIVLTLINKRNDYLFAEQVGNDEGIVFTLTDRHGDIISHGTLPISLKTFERMMIKSGYKKLGDSV